MRKPLAVRTVAAAIGVGLAVLLALVSSANAADAMKRTVLFSFDGTNGEYPNGSLTLIGSTLYGMTAYGGTGHTEGTSGYGTLFSVPVTGGAPTILFNFDGTDHGSHPNGNLTLSSDGSTFYGTASGGGANAEGTIFSIPVSGGTPTTLFDFDWTHGRAPYGSLTLGGSTLYGMTFWGGTNSYGTVFSMPVTGGTPTNLVNFATGGPDGANPRGSLTLSGSTLYGMTPRGGIDNEGTIFSVNTNGTNFQTLLSFSGSNGAVPRGDLTISGGTLYGMTSEGGDGDNGTIFSINTNGTGFQTLLSFDGINGAHPYGSLTLSPDGSTLYGMTSTGGIGGPTGNAGTVFSIPVTGGDPTILANFTWNTHGAEPLGNLTLSGSTFYGMTDESGTHSFGTVFSLNPEEVPEPATLTLLGMGALGLFGCIRRQRTK